MSASLSITALDTRHRDLRLGAVSGLQKLLPTLLPEGEGHIVVFVTPTPSPSRIRAQTRPIAKEGRWPMMPKKRDSNVLDWLRQFGLDETTRRSTRNEKRVLILPRVLDVPVDLAVTYLIRHLFPEFAFGNT